MNNDWKPTEQNIGQPVKLSLDNLPLPYTSSYISCYNQETQKLEHYNVPYDVYVYIKQLECEIKYKSGGVQKLYSFRFGETK